MPCRPIDTCFEFTNSRIPTVTCTDRGSSTRYIYSNRSLDKLTKYRVDGCLIIDGAKCDYLLLNCDKKKSYFIELKGSDLIRAVEQIDRTIDLLKAMISDFSISARIVLTRVNTTDLSNSQFLRLEKKVKGLNGDLKKQSQEMTEVN